jgi:hypothetical protein
MLDGLPASGWSAKSPVSGMAFAVMRRWQSGTRPLPSMSMSTRRFEMSMSAPTTFVLESSVSPRSLYDGAGLPILTCALPQQPSR